MGFFEDIIKGGQDIVRGVVSDPLQQSYADIGAGLGDIGGFTAGLLFGKEGQVALGEGGIITGGAEITGKTTGALFGGVGSGIAKSLGIDPKMLIIVAAVIGVIILFMVLK